MLNEPTDRYNTILTETLLHGLTRRLSSRDDCRGIEYRVEISVGPDQMISFYPPTTVFPNTHERKEHNRLSVLEHVIHSYVDDTVELFYTTDGRIVICNGTLVPGTYEYRLSVDKKRRKWFRIK